MTATGRIVTAQITVGTVLRVVPAEGTQYAYWAVPAGSSMARPASNRRDSVPAIVTGIEATMTQGHGRAQRYYALQLQTAAGDALTVHSAPGQTHMLAREGDWTVPAAVPAVDDLEPATLDAGRIARDYDKRPLTADESLELERLRARYGRPAVDAGYVSELDGYTYAPADDAQPAGERANLEPAAQDWELALLAGSMAAKPADAASAGAGAIADAQPAAADLDARTVTLWLCVDCIIMLANDDASGYEAHGPGCEHGGPLSALPAGETVPGIGESEHECGRTFNADTECGCERVDFSRAQCDGCACTLAGERNGATHFAPVAL